jgi:anti-anti-sigma regulatory factor
MSSSMSPLRRSGGQMALIAPRLEARRLLALTRLDTVLPIYESENEALTSARVEVLI